ncbi:hypothetical protein SAY87_013494 [Trapa incisa]|uniref:Cyclic nucleotide-binding domain-containing protein n=1 Tax=Trapa incisa TaxID=236973 RepID=A0AAN7QD10_9MYRT|nr:hypothetical protein SAY87_013494 [Trapa incisa]
MGASSSRFSRVQDDNGSQSIPTATRNVVGKQSHIFNGRLPQASDQSTKPRESLGAKVISVFSEDFKRGKRKILDPRENFIRQWNNIFLVACIISLFVDPLFFYLQLVRKDQCIDIGFPLEITLTMVRSIADTFYAIQIFIRFRTAYVAPSSRVFGRGELVIDPSKIASRYIRTDFFIDLVAALPLPQMLIWIIIPSLSGSIITNTKNMLRFIIIIQYIPRLFLIYPLSSQIIDANGVVMETAWAGAAYNLTLYMLASHVLGACWYLLSVQRQESCWRSVCDQNKVACKHSFFDCDTSDKPERIKWFQSSHVSSMCSPTSDYYQFGIFSDALTKEIMSSPFPRKYFYCLRWGLKNLSSLGQSLYTSTYVGEILFAVVIATLGLVLFALLIGNMQRYLQSTSLRLEEWRVKKNDMERWMHHRQLPLELRKAIRSYDQYKWVATRGVDEESILRSLPTDLRRDIKRHLSLELVRKVPLFEKMDERMLDAICERLKPALCTGRTVLMREGDPVSEMLFIIRGHLDSYTTNGGRTGFFNSCQLGPGNFCGEELLTWALEGPRPSVIFPSSTRTVKAITEVEAFALRADDLKFVAAQYRRLHSKTIRHKLRFYSHSWQTWAACVIQVAWCRHRQKKEVAELRARENPGVIGEAIPWTLGYSSKGSIYRYSGSSAGSSMDISSLQKPEEPDFPADEN